tara:strand:- start:226 stop:474 length:249 start_codon:yes stop_codon:yes gene_type:complete
MDSKGLVGKCQYYTTTSTEQLEPHNPPVPLGRSLKEYQWGGGYGGMKSFGATQDMGASTLSYSLTVFFPQSSFIITFKEDRR